MFKRILIANRGEIALRIIRACQTLGIESVAVYSQADQQSPHLKEATQKICIGAGPSHQSYLNQEAILQAALQLDCQAIHPGYGFLSENARFATRCLQQKTTFIGPTPQTLRIMGDKAQARNTMEHYGIKGVPGSEGIISCVQQAYEVAQDIGFPVLLKATAGGGGKGMRICRQIEDLPRAFEQAQLEAQSSFSNPDLYLEKFIEHGRHIEFQILADQYGQVIHLGERECSTQRANQKIIEEAPSLGVSEEVRTRLGQRLCKVLSQIGYRGAGTIEFLRDDQGHLYFMEMNTRLQVEHPVTEMITGQDLVAWQIKIAAGQPLQLTQEEITFQGHAIECRINAEDPIHQFRPAPGRLTHVDIPESWRYALNGPIRLDTHIQSGYQIPTLYDSMLAKLIVHAPTRTQAIEQMNHALTQFKIEGVPTTINLHRSLLQSVPFQSGQYSTAEMLKEIEQFAVESQKHP